MAKHKRNQRQPRGENALRRAGPLLQPRKLFLIVCEGKETEYLYFEAIRKFRHLSNVTIKVDPGAGQALQLVERALDLRERQRQSRDGLPFDEVWCVMDREGERQPAHFDYAVAKARREGLELAISNPSFEYWYLLHFRETSAYLAHSDAAEQALAQRGCLPAYKKNVEVFVRLWPHTQQAIERAERLYERHPERDHDTFPNPSTLVFQLVSRLLF